MNDENSESNKNIVEKDMQILDEAALLIVSDKNIGVTNDIADVVEFIKTCQKENTPLHIIPGYKEGLLDLEQRILLVDEVFNSLGSNKIINPVRVDEYNLIDREERVSNKLTSLGRGTIL